MTRTRKTATGYDKYVNWKLFAIPMLLLVVLLLVPPTAGMRDVGTEYALGEKVVLDALAQELFGKKRTALTQWQLLTCQIMESSMRSGSMKRQRFFKRNVSWCQKKGIPVSAAHLEQARDFVRQMDDQRYRALLQKMFLLRTRDLDYAKLSKQAQQKADKGSWQLKVALAGMVFMVFCFLTECIPLPIVSFFIGLLFTFTGVVGRSTVASLYWSDACWFIMGSLMFAAAFVKTGVDKRICLFLFSKLVRPRVGIITLVMVVVIAPAASFISDHALAAMFLPIAMILFQGSQGPGQEPDLELGKMLLLTVAMACNIGGFGSPSGGARNVILMTYLKDMFGVDIGYLTWVTYAMPFVLVMIPITWFLLQRRFKPQVRDLSPAMILLRKDIERMGPWNREQIVTLIIFVAMIWFWFTEKAFYQLGIYPVRLGIGVVAVGGAVAYVLAGVVNWRTYQEKVDWGVVWLYAGAILFGRVLDETGAAYYLARTAVDAVSSLGLGSGMALLTLGSVLTSVLTQFMADGPAAAAVGPVTLNMAGIANPGTTLVPFMGMATAAASSFAYCLIIGTPPNAIVYASGLLTPKDFLRIGLPLWLVANVVLVLLMVFYWSARGFAGLPGF